MGFMGELGHPVGRRPCRDGCGVDDAGAGREFHVAMLFGAREGGREGKGRNGWTGWGTE